MELETYVHTVIISGATETCQTSKKSNLFFGIGNGETQMVTCYFGDDGEAGVEIIEVDLFFFEVGAFECGIDGTGY